MRVGRTSEIRRSKTHQADQSCFAPLRAEHRWIELGAGEEGEKDGSRGGEECDPALGSTEQSGAHEGADEQLRNRADDDLREGRRDSEPNRDQCRGQSETQPERRAKPDLGHREPLHIRAERRRGETADSGLTRRIGEMGCDDVD